MMKQEEKTQRTRARILDAAVREFGAKGYDRATIGSICEENHIPKGLVYHNFAGKDALYLECVGQCFDAVAEYLQSQQIDGDLRRYMQCRIAFFQGHPLWARIFFEAVLQPPAGLEGQIRQRKSRLDRLNQEIYRQTISTLRLREGITQEAAMEYYGIMLEMFNGYFSSPAYAGTDLMMKMTDHEQKLTQILDILLYGLARKDDP